MLLAAHRIRLICDGKHCPSKEYEFNPHHGLKILGRVAATIRMRNQSQRFKDQGEKMATRDLTIHKAIVHKLVKEQHQPRKKSVTRTTLLPATNPSVEILVRSLIKVYATRYNRVQYGIFSVGGACGKFPGEFQVYANKKTPSDDDFIRLSKDIAMDELERSSDQKPASSGGYIVFADVNEGDSRYYYVVMVKEERGLRFTPDLNPEQLLELDLKRIHQGCRISFDKLSEYLAAGNKERQEIRYLSFVSLSANQDAAGYFKAALGCSAGSASKKATDTVIREGLKLFGGNDELKQNKKAFREELVSYLEEKGSSEKPARLADILFIVRKNIPLELGEDKIDKYAEDFGSLLNNDENQISPEFPVSRSVVKRFTHIKSKGNYFDLSFQREALGTGKDAKISYDPDNKSITLTVIPQELIEQVEKELADREQ